jgi:hypothetical protein
MTGEAAVRRAEDVGGQELSYAEVKAIASGNPAVLTLAEADAELQRLSVLRRNHADEQYLAHRKLRELPEQIDRLERRRDALAADRRAVAGAAPDVLVIGSRSVPFRDAPAALTPVLERLPDAADRRFPLGTYRGLSFGIETRWNNWDVYLCGAAVLHAPLAKESRGPRAVLNALHRIAASYDERVEAAGQELDLARTQLRDYEARLGRPFAHADYLGELTALRDRLKVALSGTPTEGEPTPAELAGRITALTASHRIVAAPARVREGPRSAPAHRSESPTEAPSAEMPADNPPPVKPADSLPDNEHTAPRTYRDRVRKSVQRTLF